MLSTDKAYTVDEVKRFVERVEKAAREINLDPSSLDYRITPKLDGMAGNYEDGVLASRGNGLVGNNITSILGLGVVADGGHGLGEIVVNKNYFHKQLSQSFAHPRNFIVGLVGCDKLNDDALKALAEGSVRFVSYESLNSLNTHSEELIDKIDAIYSTIVDNCKYPVDGIVIEVTDQRIKDYMGSTAHHHRWQIAKKEINEKSSTTVKSITWQVGLPGS